MKRIAFVSVARSDYGIYRPLLRALWQSAQFEMQLIVAGNHRAPGFGNTIREIEKDAWPIAACVDMTLAADSPTAMAMGMGLGCIGLAQAYERLAPDLIFVLGDRFEMLAAAAAATPFPIPIAHLYGGCLTEGARDDAVRHAVTKLAHLHFVEMEPYRQRILQLGEEPNRVFTVGSLAIDEMQTTSLLTPAELSEQLGLDITSLRPLLATYHPVTQESGQAYNHMTNLLMALDEVGLPVVVTYSNADPEGQVINGLIEDWVKARPQAVAIPHLGAQRLYSLYAQAAAMVGNSSSGIVEAASFRLPVVNIGNRQKNRIAPANVLHCSHDTASIVAAIRRAVSPEFRQGLAGLVNPYGDGKATQRIMEVLKHPPPGGFGTLKRFHDLV